MSKKRYEVTLLVDASRFVEIDATSPEEAAELADAKYGHVNLCHQCTDEIETGDIYGAHVYLNGEQVADTTRAGELEIQLAALKEENERLKLINTDSFVVIASLENNIKTLKVRLAGLEGVLRLALEYWQHRQQRYKNRFPSWVVAAKEALKEPANEG